MASALSTPRGVKEFTLRDVAEALINDKTPKAKGSFFKDQKGVNAPPMAFKDDGWSDIGSSCALGGAALSLGIKPGDLSVALDAIDCSLGLRSDSTILRESTIRRIGDKRTYLVASIIIGLNDRTTMSKKEIGERILKYCADFLDVKMTATEMRYRVSSAIKQ